MIQFVKLSNGETIIADVLGVTDKFLTVLNPIEVSIKGVSSATKASMIGYQWLPLLEDENIIEINTFHIVALADASIEIKEFYVEVVDQYIYPEKYEQEELEKYAEQMKRLQALQSMTANTTPEQVH